MTRHLMPAGIWLLTLLLAIVSAMATPRVSLVQRHALLHSSSSPLYAVEPQGKLVNTLSNE